MEKNYDCVLLSPPSRMINHYRPPLSLIHLGGYLTHKGLKVRIVDIPMRDVVRNRRFWANKGRLLGGIRSEMLNQVKNNPSNYIGVSCYSTEYQEVRDLIQDIRKVSRAKIVVGGVHPTLCPNDFDGLTDYTVRGIGEMCLYSIITEKTEKTEKTLDDFCFPNYDLVDMEYYTQANPYCIRGVYLRATYFLAGYGCPSSCTFCVAKSLRPFFGFGQMRNPRIMVDDILYLKDRYHIDGFYFIDDLFTLRKQKVLDFCSLIVDKGLLWGCSSKVTTLNEETIKTMSEAGCIQMDFGVERGTNEALQKLKKGQTVEKVKEIFSLCKKYKIRTFANFIVNIPGEDESARRHIETLIKSLQPTITSLNTFRGYLGTELPDKIPSKEVEEWVRKTTPKVNSLWRNLRTVFEWRYIKGILTSKRKGNYLKQLWILIKEIINQKLAL